MSTSPLDGSRRRVRPAAPAACTWSPRTSPVGSASSWSATASLRTPGMTPPARHSPPTRTEQPRLKARRCGGRPPDAHDYPRAVSYLSKSLVAQSCPRPALGVSDRDVVDVAVDAAAPTPHSGRQLAGLDQVLGELANLPVDR